MKLIILGHSGFIGQHIVRQAKNRLPQLQIVGVSSQQINLEENENAKTFAEMLDRDTVLIVASAIKKQLGDNLDTYQKNINIALNVAKAISISPVKHVIYISSSAVYGENEDNLMIDETTALNPSGLYGLGKVTVESIFSHVVKNLSASTCLTILRPPLVYGANDKSLSYGPTSFLSNALQGNSIAIWGDGSELREFLFVEDLANLIAEIVKNPINAVLNPCAGVKHCYQDIVSWLNDQPIQPLTIETRQRNRQKVNLAFENANIRSILPEFEFTPLHRGLSSTWEHMIKESDFNAKSGG